MGGAKFPENITSVRLRIVNIIQDVIWGFAFGQKDLLWSTPGRKKGKISRAPEFKPGQKLEISKIISDHKKSQYGLKISKDKKIILDK